MLLHFMLYYLIKYITGVLSGKSSANFANGK